MTDLGTHLTKLDGYLARYRAGGLLNRINGKDCAGAKGTFDTITPIDKSVICTVARGDASDIDKAAKAAKDAFPAWRDMPALQRKKILIKIAEGIEARAEEIALCECYDTGRTVLCLRPLCVALKTFGILRIR
jgi:5-carboxymethyl-2-hydroxymuconic-semialdehyde dehydrogenase